MGKLGLDPRLADPPPSTVQHHQRKGHKFTHSHTNKATGVRYKCAVDGCIVHVPISRSVHLQGYLCGRLSTPPDSEHL